MVLGGVRLPSVSLFFNRLTFSSYAIMRNTRPTLAEIRRINNRRARMERITYSLQEGCGWAFLIGFVTLMCGTIFGASPFLVTFAVGCMMASVATLLVWLIINSIFNH